MRSLNKQIRKFTLLKKSKKPKAKKLEVNFIWNRKQNLNKIGSRHNSTTEKCRILFKYENER